MNRSEIDSAYSFREGSCSWGRYPTAVHHEHPLQWRTETLLSEFTDKQINLLPFGKGRSYGDVCLNDEGALLTTGLLDRIITFDPSTGVLEAEAGMTLEQLLRFAVPKGWFLPVSPGTQFVTLGGAVANDIHGKNHHCAGTFGRHVLSIELERSEEGVVVCSREAHGDLFAATVAGLGLTGLIRTITLQLKRIESPYFDVETIKFDRYEEFFEIASESDQSYDYTVAWIDCVNRSPHLGRGHFMRGNHSPAQSSSELLRTARRSFLSVPVSFPRFVLSRKTVSLFNHLYYHRQREKIKVTREHYRPFFYPLDSVRGWNKIYGRGGFLQFQCVIPVEKKEEGIGAILERVVENGKASFLAVIKEFGEIRSPGMLSFPRPGVTLCLDFPMEGASTLRLFHQLEELVCGYDGALYPAKDACMRPESFQKFFPRLEEFKRWKDPKFSSSFWRRMQNI